MQKEHFPIKPLLNIGCRVIITVMSITIQLEDFQSWSEVFAEIERQRNMRLFEIIKPNPSAIRYREKNRGSFLAVNEGRRFSERENRGHIPTEEQSRVRLTSSPCTTISEMKTDNPENLQRDPRFTDAARKLSKEEMASLYEDIVKPLDVYSILIEKRKEMSERK